MMTLATLALVPALAVLASDVTDLGVPIGGGAAVPPDVAHSAEISVLTYNVRGLPWPLARGRAKALKAIGAELATMRRDGRQPDVVLIQEGFRGEVGDLVRASGYRYWASGPGRSERASGAGPENGRRYATVRYPSFGEGWGKFTGAGLHVLSDAPITDVRDTPYRYCAGLDCLANKGVMLARLALPGAPREIDIVNTHLNSRRAAKVPLARSLRAHNLQTEELMSFINAHRDGDRPLLVGGDFNVRNAPDRYDYRSAERPYQVVSEFCNRAADPCEGQALDSPAARPWLRSQDLQAFASAGPVTVRPIRIETLFGASSSGPRLSDHDGYLVRYRLSWDPAVVAAASPRPPVELRPQLRRGLGLKVTWRR
jgi:endonuclease/exonuclease/phosphatase family metal-dependent hydrolase